MVSEDDLFGVFFVGEPNWIRWDSYYRTIDALRPLFGDGEFNEVVKGFYLNSYGDSVRISYFVSKEDQGAVSRFTRFFRETGLVEVAESKRPRRVIVAEDYGGVGYELRFRNFLVMETRIGLEMMESDLLQVKTLLAIYRWQIRKASLDSRAYFEPTLERLSPTYNSFSEDEKVRFFTDLDEWPNPPQVDWAHLMVNLVLGCDWISVFGDSSYLTPNRPLPIPEINNILRGNGLGFEIPVDWKP